MPRLRPLRKDAQASVEKAGENTSAAQLFEAPPPAEEDKPFGEADAGEQQQQVADGAQQQEQQKQPEPEDDRLALRKQVEDLAKAETLAKQQMQEQQRLAEQFQRERDEAIRKAAEQGKEVLQSQQDAILNALNAATAEAAKAKTDIKNAIDAGDSEAQTEAYERLAKATSNINRLEEGKDAIERQIKESPQLQERTVDQGDPIDRMQMPQASRDMLKQHRDYLTNPRLNAKLNNAHFDAIDAGHSEHSDAYREFIAIQLGWKEKPQEQQKEQQKEQQTQPNQQQQRMPPVSAPVSRETPSAGNGQRQSGPVTLTAEQREYARISGITEAEYAKQVKKLQEAKANGQYTGGQ